MGLRGAGGPGQQHRGEGGRAAGNDSRAQLPGGAIGFLRGRFDGAERGFNRGLQQQLGTGGGVGIRRVLLGAGGGEGNPGWLRRKGDFLRFRGRQRRPGRRRRQPGRVRQLLRGHLRLRGERRGYQKPLLGEGVLALGLRAGGRWPERVRGPQRPGDHRQLGPLPEPDARDRLSRRPSYRGLRPCCGRWSRT